MEQEIKLIAVTTVVGPNIPMNKKDRDGNPAYRQGRRYKPGDEIILDETWDEEAVRALLDNGNARVAGQEAFARYVKATDVRVGQVGSGEHAVDLEADLRASGKDGEILGQLDQIESDQQTAGIDPAAAQRRVIEVNAETGEVSGDDDPAGDLEDAADAQVG